MNYPPYNITDKMLTYVSNIMKKIVDVFPLTQGIKILKSAILGQSVENIIIPIVIMLIITAICSAVEIKCFKWE